MSVGDEAKKIVMKLTGMWWPDGDEGKLRDAAAAWRTFAGDVETLTAAANTSARTLIENNKGKAISAFDDPFWRRYYYGGHGWLKDMSDSARDLATALDQYADSVHHAVTKLEHELEIVGATIVAGTALAFFTAGLTEAAAAAASAEILDLSATLGVAVTTEVATIAGTTLATAAIAGLEAVTVDLAVTQPIAIATGESTGLDFDEATDAALYGMVFGGGLGAAGGTAKAVADNGGLQSLLGGLKLSSADFDAMGKARTWNLFRAPDSNIPVAPRDPGDYQLISGDPVYFGADSTTIGYDERTLNNTRKVARLPGTHDVIVHGTDKGYFITGRVNAAGNSVLDQGVSPQQIADAIRSNPNYHGEPVRLISCYSGADFAGETWEAPSLPLGQIVANELGVPVTAPTSKVGTAVGGGLNQTPEIGDNGYWRIYLPTVQ